MTSAATTDAHDNDRWLKARVDLVVTSLPLTIVLNPIWAALSIIPLGGNFPAFGTIAQPLLFAIVGLHLFNSVAAAAVYAWARRTSASAGRIFVVLLMLQVWVSMSWGVGVLLCWDDGNTTNNTFLALLIIAMMWALALTRSVHPLLFALGIVPMMAMFWMRAALGVGEAAEVFTIFTPVFTAYAWFMGVSARDRVNQVLRARFELEDMASALEVARAQAVAKSSEAEAASASKSAFVANMSHELRTPLNAILGFAEIIESEAVGPQVSDQYRAYAHDIRQSGEHLLNLINDMLDIAKIEAGKMDVDCKVIDARPALDAAVRIVAQRAEAKRQTITVNVDPQARLLADERALKQILLNLLSNAIKFTPDGGTIEVHCTSLAGGGVRVAVSDSGPGIPEDKLKKLFQPFSRVDNRYDRAASGTGLGLALVRGLAALHAGKAWLENKASGGLMACVEFPPRDAQAKAA